MDGRGRAHRGHNSWGVRSVIMNSGGISMVGAKSIGVRGMKSVGLLSAA